MFRDKPFAYLLSHSADAFSKSSLYLEDGKEEGCILCARMDRALFPKREISIPNCSKIHSGVVYVQNKV